MATAGTQTPQLDTPHIAASPDAVSAGPDLRRITEHDRDYQRLHRQTVARLSASILALVRTLRHSQRDRSTDPAQALSSFAQRQGAILRRAYEDAWREGVRDYWQQTSRKPHKHLPVAPSEAALAKHLAFYAPSVGKMAQEALTAAYASPAQTLAEPTVMLAGKDGDPLTQWQAGVQQRVELQAHLTWTGLQDGYAAAGMADPASPYAVLYWNLGPVKTHHCGDCPLIAAGSPYDRPGTPGGHELNQTPGDGRTECGAACHCSLDYGIAPTAQQAQSIWQDAKAVPPAPPGSLKWPDVPQPTAAEVDAAQKQLLDDYRTQFGRWEQVRGTLPSLPDLFGTAAEGGAAAQWGLTWDALTPVQQSVLADVFGVLAKVDATFGYPSLEEAVAAAQLSQQDLADLQAKMQGMVDHLDDFQQQLAQATEADWIEWFGKGPIASFFWSLRQDFYDVLEWLINRTEPPIPPDQLSEPEHGMVLYNPYHYPAGGPQGGQFAPRGGGGAGGGEIGGSHTGGQHEAQHGGLHAAYGTHAHGGQGAMSGESHSAHIHEKDVAEWTKGNAADVPPIGVHYTKTAAVAKTLKTEGIDVNHPALKPGEFGRGFYMFDARGESHAMAGQSHVRVAIRMQKPYVGSFDKLYAADTTKLLAQGYDGLIARGKGRSMEIVAFKPGTVRVIVPDNTNLSEPDSPDVMQFDNPYPRGPHGHWGEGGMHGQHEGSAGIPRQQGRGAGGHFGVGAGHNSSEEKTLGSRLRAVRAERQGHEYQASEHEAKIGKRVAARSQDEQRLASAKDEATRGALRDRLGEHTAQIGYHQAEQQRHLDAAAELRTRESQVQAQITAIRAARVAAQTGAHVIQGNANAKTAMQHLFGHELSDAEMTHLMGARPGDTLVVRGIGPHLLEVHHFGPGYNAQSGDASHASFTAQHYLMDLHGQRADELHYMHVANAGQGEGAQRVADLVRGLRAAGFRFIALDASRGVLGNGILANGYYTWPRLGWTARLTDKARAMLPKALAGARQVRHLFRTPAGRDWWREHGTVMGMRFYLQGNTPSIRTLNAYLHEKGLPPV